jgi:biopolymer transport protein ExbD
MSGRRRRRRLRELVSSELELMPMLNVFLAIIPLLLLSAAFTPVAIIPASLPADGSVADAAAEEPVEPPLDLVIRILPDRYVIQGRGLETQSIERPSVPRDDPASQGARDRLSAALQEIAAAHPSQHEVRIASEPGTHYEEIVDVMDASRTAGFSQSALCEASSGGA